MTEIVTHELHLTLSPRREHRPHPHGGRCDCGWVVERQSSAGAVHSAHTAHLRDDVGVVYVSDQLTLRLAPGQTLTFGSGNAIATPVEPHWSDDLSDLDLTRRLAALGLAEHQVQSLWWFARGSGDYWLGADARRQIIDLLDADA